MSITQVRAACPHDCPDTCAMLVTVEDGVATKVQGNPEHPPTHGALCTKVSRYTERTYHPERVLHPLQARRPQGQRPLRAGQLGRGARRHRRAPAGDRRARRRRRSCPTAMPERWAWCRARAWRRASSTGSARRCSTARSAPRPAARRCAATYGAKVGMHVEHFAESQLIVIWGSNSITSNLHFWTLRAGGQARRREAGRASTRAAPRPPRSATSTSRCCPAPTARSRSA